MLASGLANDLAFDLVNALACRFRSVYRLYLRVETLADLGEGVAAIL